MPELRDLWIFLLFGYCATILFELPIVLIGLSRRHDWRRRLFAGLWLTACTYPMVVIVFPLLLWEQHGYVAYVTVAEIFAPLAECGLFWLAFDRRPPASWRELLQDMATIVLANLASFLIGGWLIETWLYTATL